MPRPMKTIEEHFHHGTIPQNRLPGSSDMPAGMPAKPKRLSAPARKMFRQLCALLEERRQLTKADGELLRLYAQLWDRQRHAQDHIDQEGEVCEYTRLDSNGVARDQFKPNLWLAIAERAEKSMVAILDRLGLTPVNRSRVRPLKSAEPPDEFEQFMNKHNDLGFHPNVAPFKLKGGDDAGTDENA
jgi:P27 family predicted phage terminase small subunit